jgi:hypothetical protein
MVTLEVQRLESGMPYIAISMLEALLRLAYEQDAANSFISEFNAMLIGNTLAMVNDETAIYPHDVAAIFCRLQIPVKFVDVKGDSLEVIASASGIPTTGEYYY